jgi:hypothetical protein
MALRQLVYKPLLGSGKVYMRPYGGSAALTEIGNVSKLEFGIDEDVKKMTDYTKAGGGTYAQVNRIKSVSVSLTVMDLNPANVARALFGSADSVTGAVIADEPHTAYKGGLIRLAHPKPTAVTVTNDAGSTTYVSGTDYEVRPEGIYIPQGSAIADATAVKIDYTYATYDVVQALTVSSPEVQLAFGGINEADSGNPVLVDAWRVKLGAAKKLGLIGSDFAELQIEGEVLADPTKTGAGISRYLRVQQV